MGWALIILFSSSKGITTSTVYQQSRPVCEYNLRQFQKNNTTDFWGNGTVKGAWCVQTKQGA